MGIYVMKPHGGGGYSTKGGSRTPELVHRSAIVVAGKENGFIGDIAKFDFKPTGLTNLRLPQKYDIFFKEIYIDTPLLRVKSAVEEAALKIKTDPIKYLIPLKTGANPKKFLKEKEKHLLFWRGLGYEESPQGLEFSWLRLLVFSPKEVSQSLFLFRDGNLNPVLDLAQHHFNFAIGFPFGSFGEKEKETLLYLLLAKDIEVWKLFGRINELKICDEPRKGEPVWLKIIAKFPIKETISSLDIKGNFILNVTTEFLKKDRREVAQYFYQKYKLFLKTGKFELLEFEEIENIENL